MISVHEMAEHCLELLEAGEHLIDVEMLRSVIADARIEELRSSSSEGHLASQYRRWIRDAIDREVDERFPKKLVSHLLREGYITDQPEDSLCAVGVGITALEHREQLMSLGVNITGSTFDTKDGPITLHPHDFLPGRHVGPAVALLFIPDKSVPWYSIWAAYVYKRLVLIHGASEAGVRIKQSTHLGILAEYKEELALEFCEEEEDA